MLNDMTKEYNSDSIASNGGWYIDVPRVGQPCAVSISQKKSAQTAPMNFKCKQGFFRGKIVELLGAGKVKVLLVDEGPVYEKNLIDLRLLHKR